MTDASSGQPLVVTAADRRFARTLSQFLLSAERHGEHRRCRWAIYDLGLLDADRALLARRFPWAALRPFVFAGLPPHVALAAGSYAWKPLAIREAAAGEAGPVFWFDSGTVLRQPLEAGLQALRAQGFWGLRSQMPLAQKCDPRVLEALAVPPEVRHFREYAAGAVGFDLSSPLGRRLVDGWARHALIPEHIVPEGYAPFHKHDQALLNCLLAREAFAGAFAPTTAEIDISSFSPSPMVSTRNFVSDHMPLAADPLLRARQHLYKAADRAYHRLRHFDDTRIDGLCRRWKEHFSVRLRDAASGRDTPIPGPAGGYYADPFVWQRDGRTWLFVEEFVYARDRGHISVLELDGGGHVASARPVQFLPSFAALDCHASFPFIFSHGGEICMIPETHERQAIDLFVCDRWPDRWQLARRLLFGIDAVDTMAVEHEGRWYLITSVRGGAWPNRHLEIHHSAGLLSGCFEPHPVNNRGVYGDNDFGTGRNAGLITRNHDGSLMRLMQRSSRYYGEGLQPMRITDLSPASFTEVAATSIDFLPGIPQNFPSHHMSRMGDVIVYDTRDRAR
ncbi:MAG: hypothetical protein IOC82_11760 [Aestuariivirga sp.]|uniref:glucosamine inositolphosphorylceramide transferase family protein n=1 Tax=Aestuariivirga sp. TaxID=2650926 RepID=UPI0025C2B980|nr:hypothetical protein [Aestuariivirga sp.]MCA3561692.1 hypothetical protein [Aestuariivirga sp.]